MYFHCRPIKYVEYNKVYPFDADDIMKPAYIWISKYCKYFPQIWLSRSNSKITGFRNKLTNKKYRNLSRQKNPNNVLFGFEFIKGFPVDYSVWEFILNPLINNQSIASYFNSIIQYYKEDKASIDCEITKKWIKTNSEEEFLKKYLFVENDQVVVPSLNLKSAKKIICRNEKVFKKLNQMGFIKDRIIIRNDKFFEY